ncbi:cell division protein FtsA [Aquicella lusitana]|uniref:Cell division protein FtsA n=1 Tax=Aquicella lusitana TaxID=254246 RepID=A0A370GN05_9COXI|nr:cell division protein FtsA [Aquicella lusitana]RDI44780.1 cell division protein FtsA [Aquicella lusitana]VVC72977.1 Cell division protein FtsA [Aquicella lusitana]
MAKKPNKDYLVGIDIGTSKVVTLVGEMTSDGRLNVIGFGSHPSQGLKRGVVVNIESTVQSIQRSVEDAELMAGCEIYSAYTGIAGSHIRSINSHGIVAIRDHEVSQNDVDRVIDAAKAIAIPADQKILHVLPQEFIIDNQDSIREPVGMSGVRLEAKVHIVTGAVSAAQNIVKCMKRCGLAASDIVLEQFASSQSILSDDEKELGVCMIDIGGGTSDIAIFTDGAIRHTAVIPIAGDQVTNDIAIALRTPTRNAEEIKIKYGCALQDLVDTNQMIDIPTIGDKVGRRLPQRALAEVVEARYEELFTLALTELRRSGLEEFIAAGIVLTGGASKIHGAQELAERIFKVPVRIGKPNNVTGLSDIIQNPVYATGVGLLVYGLRQRQNQREIVLNQPSIKGLWSRMKSWFQGNF